MTHFKKCFLLFLILFKLPTYAIASRVVADAIVSGVVADGTEAFSKNIVAFAELGKDGQYHIFCTGSIWNQNSLITAAHCITKHPGPKFALFGLSNESGEMVVRKLRPEREKAHENYEPVHMNKQMDISDIAVVQIQGEIPANYKPANRLSETFIMTTGIELLAAGYGHVNQDYFHYGAGRLRYTYVSITKVSATEMRADEKLTGTCSIDSGGPIFIEEEGRYYLAGVISRGPPSCKGIGTYGQIVPFYNWIENTIAKWEE